MFGKKLKFWLLLGGIFIAPLALFSTKMTPWDANSRFGMIVQELTYPFAWLWTTSVRGTSSAWNRYIALHHTANENEVLKAQINELKVKLLDHEEKTVELNRLRKLAGFTEQIDDKFTVAEVLMGQRNSPFKTIRVSKGSMDGVSPGMPVVTAEGAVGRIIRSGSKMSDVQLLVDYDSNLDVLIQRNRVRGVLSGFATQECRLHLQRGTEVKIGDTLITSGIVGSFPKGIPVGKIVKISFESDNVSQMITVEPWVDHRRLEEVIILQRSDPDLERIVQTGGPDWIETSTNPAAGG